MRSLLLTLSVVLLAGLVTGCSSSNNKGKLEGTRWRSDAVKDGKTTIPIGAKELEFRMDGTLTFAESGQSSTGSYALGSGDSVTLKLKKPVGKSPVKKIFVDGNKLILTKEDGTEDTFIKAGDIR